MSSFDGFPREGFEFLTGLGADNSKAFFDEHRATYVEAVATPSRLFVERMTPLLQDAVHRDLRGEAKVGRSLFRINRDVRFARDKTRGPALNRYHALLANPVDGPEIRAVVDALVASGSQLTEPARARPPKGFPADHPNADLARRDGFHLHHTTAHPEVIAGPGFAQWCADQLVRYQSLLALLAT